MAFWSQPEQRARWRHPHATSFSGLGVGGIMEWRECRGLIPEERHASGHADGALWLLSLQLATICCRRSDQVREASVRCFAGFLAGRREGSSEQYTRKERETTVRKQSESLSLVTLTLPSLPVLLQAALSGSAQWIRGAGARGKWHAKLDSLFTRSSCLTAKDLSKQPTMGTPDDGAIHHGDVESQSPFQNALPQDVVLPTNTATPELDSEPGPPNASSDFDSVLAKKGSSSISLLSYFASMLLARKPVALHRQLTGPRRGPSSSRDLAADGQFASSSAGVEETGPNRCVDVSGCLGSRSREERTWGSLCMGWDKCEGFGHRASSFSRGSGVSYSARNRIRCCGMGNAAAGKLAVLDSVHPIMVL